MTKAADMIAKLERAVISEVISMYHTTRLDHDATSHVHGKITVQKAFADLIAHQERQIEALREAVLGVVAATRAYLPPDGITEQECINRVLEATDNPKINPLILEAETC